MSFQLSRLYPGDREASVALVDDEGVSKHLVRGSRWVELDSRLGPRAMLTVPGVEPVQDGRREFRGTIRIAAATRSERIVPWRRSASTMAARRTAAGSAVSTVFVLIADSLPASTDIEPDRLSPVCRYARRSCPVTVVRIPGSKSITARALFLAAAAEGRSTLRAPLVSDDTEAFATGLEQLGFPVGRATDHWVIDGHPSGPPVTDAEVYCRDAGTAARFLPGLAASGHGTFRFDASAQLRRRPVGPLTDALRALGVDVRHAEAEGHLPITVAGRGITGGDVTLDAGLSSQFLTAILLMGPLTDKGVRVTVTDLVSAPYVDMTVAMMRAFGSEVGRDGNTFHVPPDPYRAVDYAIEPDASAASYFLAAAAISGTSITIPGLGSESLQGDIGFVDVLRRMGARVDLADNEVTVTGPALLDGLTVNMRDISDTMPTLAAIAPFASGPVRIEDVYNTRVKECDRLDACAGNLRALGIRVETGRDWIEISPGTPTPARIACHGDHRIAMSFSITGLRTPGLVLDDPDCVKKTFPGFHAELATLQLTR